MPLFRGFHGSLVPAARPGIHEKKPLLRKAFADLPHMSPNPIEASGGCGPRTPKGLFDRLLGTQVPPFFVFGKYYLEDELLPLRKKESGPDGAYILLQKKRKTV
ncbi:MAG: hypothetical protein ACI4NL_06725 [Christensenellales bacterium]